MVRVREIAYEAADPQAKREWDAQVKAHGRMTNMKRTLAHSGTALNALMAWYPLRDAVRPFLGDRLTTIFAHAVSSESDCLICSTFFRRLLKESGDDPDDLKLSEAEADVVAFGRAIAKERSRVPPALFAKLRGRYTDRQLVEMTAFASLMLATNVINNALEIPLDDYLEAYKKR